MQITLNQEEIEKAIITFVGNQGISITGKHVDVTLIAGRAPNGMSASIVISNDDAQVVPTLRSKSMAAQHVTVVEVSDEEAEAKEESEEVTGQRPLFGK